MKGIEDVVWDAQGRVLVIVQDAGSRRVLAIGQMDRAALTTSLTSGQATYWTPDDEAIGGCASAGTLQMVTGACLACDGRAVLLSVQPAGPLCRSGAASCFEEVLSLEAARVGGVRVAGAGREEATDIRWLPEAAEGAPARRTARQRRKADTPPGSSEDQAGPRRGRRSAR